MADDGKQVAQVAKGMDPDRDGVMEKLGDFKASPHRGQWDIKPNFGKREVPPEKKYPWEENND